MEILTATWNGDEEFSYVWKWGGLLFQREEEILKSKMETWSWINSAPWSYWNTQKLPQDMLSYVWDWDIVSLQSSSLHDTWLLH